MSVVKFMIFGLVLILIGFALAWIVWQREKMITQHEQRMELLERELEHEEFEKLFEEDEEYR